jgi:hypothetical protein
MEAGIQSVSSPPRKTTQTWAAHINGVLWGLGTVDQAVEEAKGSLIDAGFEHRIPLLEIHPASDATVFAATYKALRGEQLEGFVVDGVFVTEKEAVQ